MSTRRNSCPIEGIYRRPQPSPGQNPTKTVQTLSFFLLLFFSSLDPRPDFKSVSSTLSVDYFVQASAQSPRAPEYDPTECTMFDVRSRPRYTSWLKLLQVYQFSSGHDTSKCETCSIEYVHFRVLSLHFTDQSVGTRTKMATQWPIRYLIAR
jgi:hypothetical protein